MRILAKVYVKAPAKRLAHRIAVVSLTFAFAGLSLPAMAQTSSADAMPPSPSSSPHKKPAKPAAKVKPTKSKTTVAKGGSGKAAAIESAAEPVTDTLPPEIGSAIDTVRGWFNR